MKILHWFGFAIIFSSISCKDISELPSKSEKLEPANRSQVAQPIPIKIYPINRKITDNQGRSIDALILGKQNLKIAFSKNSNHSKFIVALDRLSGADQEYFRNLADGGNFSEVENTLAQEARLSGRIARWHMDVETAQREAEKLNIPMLLSVMITNNPESQSLEKKLLYSKELRDWANTNLVLCMLKVDDPSTNRTTSFSAVENRNSAAKFGVADYSEPVVMLLKPSGGGRHS